MSAKIPMASAGLGHLPGNPRARKEEGGRGEA